MFDIIGGVTGLIIMYYSEEHPPNAHGYNSITPVPTSTVFNPEQYENALFSTIETLLPIFACCNPLQDEHMFPPIYVMLSGRSIDCSYSQLENA